VIRAIAKEGTVARPSLPIYFGGTKPNGFWNRQPNSLPQAPFGWRGTPALTCANSHLQADLRSQRQQTGGMMIVQQRLDRGRFKPTAALEADRVKS
jgi:hypothetical protein